MCRSRLADGEGGCLLGRRGSGGCGRKRTGVDVPAARAHGHMGTYLRGHKGTRVHGLLLHYHGRAHGRRVWWVRLVVRAEPTTRTPHETDTSGVSTSTCSPCTHSSTHLVYTQYLPAWVDQVCNLVHAHLTSRQQRLLAPLLALVPLSLPAARNETPLAHTHVGRPSRLIASPGGNPKTRAQLVSRHSLVCSSRPRCHSASTLDPTRISSPTCPDSGIDLDGLAQHTDHHHPRSRIPASHCAAQGIPRRPAP